MGDLAELRSDQIRQLIDTEQVFAAFRTARAEHDRRYIGAMSWKHVRGADYLYRKQGSKWSALGPRGPGTETAYRSFHDGRAHNRERLDGLAARLGDMAPVNRALALARVPLIAARILRALDRAKLMGTAVDVVGTHALYAYERMAGVFVSGGHLATGDVDLLYDARVRLRLLGSEMATSGLARLLRKVDRSFSLTGAGSFRAVNRDGFMVDLIHPLSGNRMAAPVRSRIGTADDDLTAVEIEGPTWLVNSPKVEAVVMDARGYPLSIVTPDPRAFAIHKLWLADRADRDPLKRRRDAAQGRLITDLLSKRLPHLRLDDPALAGLPKALRSRLAPARPDRTATGTGTGTGDEPREPDW